MKFSKITIKRLLIGTWGWKRLFYSLILIYLMVCVLVYFYAERLIFPYHGSSYDEHLSHLEMMASSDGLEIATRVWRVENELGLVVYFHGNYVDLGHLGDIAKVLNTYGYTVLAMDYRGYGLSEGSASEQKVNNDAIMLYQKAINMGYDAENIIIMGRSIGSGVATALAVEHASKALVLISPFVSTFRVMTGVHLFPFDRFNSLAIINDIEGPLFIVHGTVDDLIKPWHSDKLFEKFEGVKQKILVNGAGHNDIWNIEYRHFMDDIVAALDLFE